MVLPPALPERTEIFWTLSLIRRSVNTKGVSLGGVLEDWLPTSSSYAPTLSGDPELKSLIRDAQGSGCFKPWLGQFASARPEFSSGTGKRFRI